MSDGSANCPGCGVPMLYRKYVPDGHDDTKPVPPGLTVHVDGDGKKFVQKSRLTAERRYVAEDYV